MTAIRAQRTQHMVNGQVANFSGWPAPLKNVFEREAGGAFFLNFAQA
jgi:hypothetical protein